MVVIEHHICWPQFWSSLLEILAVSQSHGGPLISGSFSAEMDDGPAGVQSSVHYSWTSCDFSSGIPKLDTRIPSPRGKAWPLFFKKSVELLILSVPRSAAPLLQLQLLAPRIPAGLVATQSSISNVPETKQSSLTESVMTDWLSPGHNNGYSDEKRATWDYLQTLAKVTQFVF